MFLVHVSNTYLLNLGKIYNSVNDTYKNPIQTSDLGEVEKTKYTVEIPSVITTDGPSL